MWAKEIEVQKSQTSVLGHLETVSPLHTLYPRVNFLNIMYVPLIFVTVLKIKKKNHNNLKT